MDVDGGVFISTAHVYFRFIQQYGGPDGDYFCLYKCYNYQLLRKLTRYLPHQIRYVLDSLKAGGSSLRLFTEKLPGLCFCLHCKYTIPYKLAHKIASAKVEGIYFEPTSLENNNYFIVSI